MGLNYDFICFLKYFNCSESQLLELTQFSCRNFTLIHVKLSLKLIVRMSPRRSTELFPHFAHQMKFSYTQQEQ